MVVPGGARYRKLKPMNGHQDALNRTEQLFPMGSLRVPRISCASCGVKRVPQGFLDEFRLRSSKPDCNVRKVFQKWNNYCFEFNRNEREFFK